MKFFFKKSDILNFLSNYKILSKILSNFLLKLSMKTWKVYWILVEFSIYLKPEFKPETRKLKPEPENLSFAKTRTRPEPEKAEPEIPETRKIATRLSLSSKGEARHEIRERRDQKYWISLENR